MPEEGADSNSDSEDQPEPETSTPETESETSQPEPMDDTPENEPEQQDSEQGSEEEPADSTSTEPAATDLETDQATDPEEVPATTDSGEGEEGTGESTDSALPDSDLEIPQEPVPFEEVKDQIINQLAAPVASEAFKEAVEGATEALKVYERDYRKWFIENKRNEDAVYEGTVPAEKVAKQFGGKANSTPLVDRFALAKTDIGKAQQTPPPFQRGGQALTFPAFLFRDHDSTMLYRPILFETPNPSQSATSRFSAPVREAWLAWKLEETDEKVPAYEEAAEQVKSKWIHAEAFRLATEAAEQHAEKTEGTDASLTEIALTMEHKPEVVETGPISLYTQASPRSAPQPTPIPGTEGDIPTLQLESIFSAEPNTAHVVHNLNKTAVYLFKVKEIVDSDESLRDKFLVSLSDESSQPRSQAVQQARGMSQNWLRQLYDTMGVKDLRRQ